jgi:hypothetical protein
MNKLYSRSRIDIQISKCLLDGKSISGKCCLEYYFNLDQSLQIEGVISSLIGSEADCIEHLRPPDSKTLSRKNFQIQTTFPEMTFTSGARNLETLKSSKWIISIIFDQVLKIFFHSSRSKVQNQCFKIENIPELKVF